MGDINPLAQENLRYARSISLLEDIASFFSSNRKMRKSGNCWTVAWTGLIAYNGTTLRVTVSGKFIARSSGPGTISGLANLALLGRSLRFLFWPCLDMPLWGLSVGTHRLTGHPSSGQDCPLSTPSPPERGRCTLPVSCFSPGRTDPRMICPRHENPVCYGLVQTPFCLEDLTPPWQLVR